MPHVDPEIKRKYHREYARREASKAYAKERYQRLKKEDPEIYMWRGARSRARRRGLAFDIEVEDIVIPKYCPALGIELMINTKGFKDNSPSIDRIDNDKGYIKGNIQILSYKANAMKSSAAFDEIEKLYTYMKRMNDN